MRGRRIVTKSLKVILLLLSVVLFCVVYLLPSIKKINHLKRDIKGKTIALDDFSEMEQKFVMPDQEEIDCFSETERQLKMVIPTLRSKKEEAALHTEYAGQLLGFAYDYHIKKPIVGTLGHKGSKFSILSPTAEGNRQMLKHCRSRGEQLLSRSNLSLFSLGGGPVPLLDSKFPVVGTDIVIAFRAGLRKGVRFIHQLKEQQVMAHLVSLHISGTKDLPVWVLLLKLYYFDTTSGKTAYSGESTGDFPLIDLGSPLLLRDISSLVKELGKGNIFPDQFGDGIFTTQPEDTKPLRNKG